MKGEKLKGALSRGPKEKPTERLSPGVYRGSKGGLVGQRGQAIQRQPPPPQQMGGNFTGPQNDLVSRTPLPPGMTSQGFAQMIAGQPVQDMMYRYSPEEAAKAKEIWKSQGLDLDNLPPVQFGGGPTQGSSAFQMPQPSANMGGKYRLSPGVYGTREQAMQQYNRQMQLPENFQNAPGTMPQQQQQQQVPTRQQMLRKY